MTRRTAQELKELRERIEALERAGLKASAQALRDKLPRERSKSSGAAQKALFAKPLPIKLHRGRGF